jgi:hypothetical protein
MERDMRVFFGTAQEFKEVAHLFGPDTNISASLQPSEAAVGDGEMQPPTAPLSPELIEVALNRIPLSRKQSRVWRAIVDAHPNWINVIELAEKTGLTRQSIAGVWGALGRRLANTPGWPTDKWPMDEERDDENLRRYRAHETLVRLVKTGRIKLK